MMTMKIIALTTLSFFLSLNLISQDLWEYQFGSISDEEVAIQQCEFDSAASALILFDLGHSRFIKTQTGFDIGFINHKRVKVFTEAGQKYSTIQIPLYRSSPTKKEYIKTLKASTYNWENGELVETELNLDNVYDETINEHWVARKFVFPNVQNGSIIEFRYEKVSPFIFNLPDWNFQSSIPTLYSEYNVELIPFYEYTFAIQSIDQLDTRKSTVSKSQYESFGFIYNTTTHKYGLKNIEAFRDESYITSINDYIQKIDFQLSKIHKADGTSKDILSSWPLLREELLDATNFGVYIKRCHHYAKQLIKEVLPSSSINDADKIKIIVNYMKNNFQWNGFYSKYASQHPRDFMSSRSGNSADINLLLIAMLSESGIAVEPAILSTRSHGRITFDYPFDSSTNYVVAYCKSDPPLLADATRSTLSYNLIPTKCINDYALIVNKDEKDKWLKVGYTFSSEEVTKMKITIDTETTTANVELETKSSLFDAFKNRERWQNDTTAIKNTFERKFDKVQNISTENFYNTDKPYEILLDAEKELSYVNNSIIIQPFMGLSPVEHKLTQKHRYYPVDMIYKHKERFNIIIIIPKDYHVLPLPENISFDNNLVSIYTKYSLDSSANELTVQGFFQFKKAVYEPNEYQQLKSNISQMIGAINEKVVIEKSLQEAK